MVRCPGSIGYGLIRKLNGSSNEMIISSCSLGLFSGQRKHFRAFIDDLSTFAHVETARAGLNCIVIVFPANSNRRVSI